MRPYIEDLIEEVRNAAKEVRRQKKKSTDAQKDLACQNETYDKRNYLYGNPATLEEITGIPANALPPYYLLPDKHKAELSNAMEDLLEAWGFIADFPEAFPRTERYKLLRGIWTTHQVYIGTGYTYIEFCNFDRNNCPFPNHCNMCEEIDKQEELYNRLINNYNKK
jgi:hypothetical protein